VDSLEKSLRVTVAALERSALDPVLLDVREVTSFADTVLLLSGRSDRQVRAIADGIAAAMQAEGEPPLGVEGLDEGRWVLIDCNDVIVHVFLREVRDLYDLERLWSDAADVDLVALGVPAEALAQAQSGEAPAAESVR
jgi:ribosome-associated protein